MLSLTDLRAGLELDAKSDHDLPGIRAEVVAQWEALTCRRWDRVVGHVEEIESSVDTITTLFPEIRPVETLTSVEYWDGSAWAAYATTAYRLSATGTIERLGGEVWKRLVRITYTGGHADGSEPADVRQALIVQAKFLRGRLAPSEITLKSKAIKDASSVYERATYHPLFAETAKRHRRLV